MYDVIVHELVVWDDVLSSWDCGSGGLPLVIRDAVYACYRCAWGRRA